MIRATMLSLTMLLTAAGPAAAQRIDPSAETFVRDLYADYARAETAPMADAPSDPSPPSIWSRRLGALIARDIELAGDDLPYLDADPICNCQDWEGIAVRSVRMRSRGGGRAEATVRFVNGGQLNTTRFLLVREEGGWRIDDILNPPYRGLAGQLADSNRLIEAGGRALGRD